MKPCDQTHYSVWTLCWTHDLLFCSLSHCLHVICRHKIIRSVTRSCIICWRLSAVPQVNCSVNCLWKERLPTLYMYLIELAWTMPDTSTSNSELFVDQKLLKHMFVYSSLCLYEPYTWNTSNLTTKAFIASLRQFISQRGKPTLIWSDHRTNFAGAAHELKELNFWKNRYLGDASWNSAAVRGYSGGLFRSMHHVLEESGKQQ